MLVKNSRVIYYHIKKILGLNAPAIRLIRRDRLHVTEDQKSRRMKWSNEMRKMCNKKKSQVVNNIVTGDEKWLYLYDVPTKFRVVEAKEILIAVRKLRYVLKKIIAVLYSLSNWTQRRQS